MPSKLAKIQDVERALIPVCAAQDVELVQVTHQREPDGAVLRVLIEKPDAESLPPGVGGVTLDDCTRVSRALSAVLDEQEDLVPGAYRLEVSSPGVERPLVREADFVRFAGREVAIKLAVPINKRRNFSGVLEGVFEQRVKLSLEQSRAQRRGGESAETISIPLEDISKANLIYRF